MLNVHVNRRRSPSACALVVGALLLVTLPVAAAQSGPASFSGTLMDAVGRVMPDVTLTLAPGAAPQKPGTAAGTITATSDANGHFSFANLPAGDYTLQVHKMGFATTQGRVSVDSGQNLVQNIALQVAALMETITLTEPDPGAPAAILHRPPPNQVAQHVPRRRVCADDGRRLHHAAGEALRREADPPWPESLAGTGASATVKMEAHASAPTASSTMSPASSRRRAKSLRPRRCDGHSVSGSSRRRCSTASRSKSETMTVLVSFAARSGGRWVPQKPRQSSVRRRSSLRQ